VLHASTARWQSNRYRQTVAGLTNADICVSVDFSENLTAIYNHQTIGEHVTPRSFSLLVFVVHMYDAQRDHTYIEEHFFLRSVVLCTASRSLPREGMAHWQAAELFATFYYMRQPSVLSPCIDLAWYSFLPSPLLLSFPCYAFLPSSVFENIAELQCCCI
jgi:hypothetical protein